MPAEYADEYGGRDDAVRMKGLPSHVCPSGAWAYVYHLRLVASDSP
jgi:hypothetical protein